ncbi:MAG: M20 family metallopeptidase [Promethearchaeota archaeon]
MEKIEKKILLKIDSFKDEIVNFHQKMVQIRSENPPGKYNNISKFVEEKMKEIGLYTQVKRSNVIGECGKHEKPKLLFYGHMDTVEAFKGWTKNPFGGEIADGRIYGRGACDDKACVTAEIFATKALIDLNTELNGKLTVLAVIDEELGGFKGAKYLLDKNIVSGDACLLGDGHPGNPIAYFGGGIIISFKTIGKQSHGMCFPDLTNYRNEHSGINAILKMIKILNFLNELQEDFNQKETKYPICQDQASKVSHINPAIINGGNKISTVPDTCLLHCSIHTIPEQDVKSIIEKIKKKIEEFKAADPYLDVRVQIPLSYEPQITDINSKLAKVVKDSFKTVYKEERDFKSFFATTDAHFFQEKGIDTIMIGVNGGNIHAADEYVDIEDLINTTKVFALTALNYLK